ncbi:recombinase family protein [Cytobacillus suaedae]|nr:recombinase family protein [Cytobacillus suaedae]
MTNDTFRHIAIYCRVSTDEQAREGVSLQEQQERLTAYCRAMGWKEEIKLFIDDGYSAKSIERPQLTKLMDQVHRGLISKILVTKLDRMSRRLLDLLRIIEVFHEYDVSFVSISESFDTNTPSGRLTLQVLGAVAEFERERIRERVFENMYHAASQGKWLTQSPYGYRLEDKKLAIEDSEAKIVKKVFDLYLNKAMGYFAIAKQLNEEGIPSKQNKEWSLRSVKLLLSNPVYKGTLVWNRTDSSKKKRQAKDEDDWVTIDDALPVIIEKSFWDKAQKRSNQRQIAPRAKTSPHLLGGLLKCGNCGSGMSIGWSGSKNNRYRVYRCSANKNKGTCTSKQYRADSVEQWFKEGLLELSTSLNIKTNTEILKKMSQQPVTASDHKIKNAQTRYKRKVEAYTAGLIELEDLNEEKKRLDAIVNETEEPAESKEGIDINEIKQWLETKLKSIVDAIDVLPIPEAKRMISMIIDHVVIIGEDEIEISLLT